MPALNQYHSYNLGELPPGCQYCVRGEKLVLFVTGICPRKCYFCPLSDAKYGKDVFFANERAVQEEADVIHEAELMKAQGVGITGGDPLSKVERTGKYIRLLKGKFGKKFHIHLYTSLVLVTEEKLRLLFDAGLDEIRFHPDLDRQKEWGKIGLAQKFPWEVGVEIPLIPTKLQETKALIDYVQDKITFLNLNELEIADNSLSKLGEMGFTAKDSLSYAVKGSQEAGLELIAYVQEKNYPLSVHLCTAKLKDSVQLANRLKREAQGMKKAFDLVDEEGLLTRGALYLPELVPGFGYRRKLEAIDQQQFLQQLEPLLLKVKEQFHLREQDICLDHRKPRILLSAKKVRKKAAYFRRLGLVPAIVSEYPTADQLEIEVEMV